MPCSWRCRVSAPSMLLPGYREKSGTFLQLHSWGHHPPSFPFWSLPLLSRAPSGGSRYLFVSKSSTFLPAQLKLYWPPFCPVIPGKFRFSLGVVRVCSWKGWAPFPIDAASCCPREKWNFLAASFVGGITFLCFFSRVFRFPLPGKILRGSWGQSPHQASALLNRSIIFLSYACPPGAEIQKTYTLINYLYMIAEECPIVSNADTVNIF